MVYEERTGRRDALDGIVVNVSEGGIGLLVDRPIPLSLTLTVLLASHLVVGDVVACTTADKSFFVGLSVRAHSHELKQLCREALLSRAQG
jgi:hypothetical protein